MNLKQLEDMARKNGVAIAYTRISSGVFIPPEEDDIPVILLPRDSTRDERTWTLAHELGHFMCGHRVGLKPRILLEIEAWHWAKRTVLT